MTPSDGHLVMESDTNVNCLRRNAGPSLNPHRDMPHIEKR
jgi:hypothetical protein